MRKSKSSVWAGLFSAAIFGLGSSIALASPVIDGSYAAVTPQSVELLMLRTVKHEVRGTYRVLHLSPTQAGGLSDRSTTLSSMGTSPDRAFALEDARTLLLRFDSSFQNAQASAPGLTGPQTQAFSKINAEQVGLLIEMARYGGLAEECRAHGGGQMSLNSQTLCDGMASRFAGIVPFRPFPNAGAGRPVLAYSVTTRLAQNLALSSNVKTP